MRRIALFLFVFSIGSASAADRDATVRVSTPRTTGTGVIVRCVRHGDGFEVTVLTVAHAASGSPTVTLYRYSDSAPPEPLAVYPAAIVGMSPDRDVAVLRFRTRSAVPVATVDPGPIQPRDKLIRWGCGAKRAPHRADGTVSGVGYRALFADGTTLPGMIKTSVPTEPGDSGGPIFRDGKLVAITEGRSLIDAESFACPLSFFRRGPEWWGTPAQD